MGQWIIILLFTFSASAFAAKRECTLKVKTYKVEPACVGKVLKKMQLKTHSWKSCHSYALDAAKKFDKAIYSDEIVSDPDCTTHFGETTNVVFVDWKYNDGLDILDSNGQVTATTEEFDKKPKKGNRAFDKVGERFF